MRRWSYIVANYLALASFAIAFTAFGGHLFERIGFFTRWGRGAEMSANTALALVLLSLAVCLISFRKDL